MVAIISYQVSKNSVRKEEIRNSCCKPSPLMVVWKKLLELLFQEGPSRSSPRSSMCYTEDILVLSSGKHLLTVCLLE